MTLTRRPLALAAWLGMALGAAGLGVARPAAADGLSPAAQHFLKNMDANFRGVEPDNAFCKGDFEPAQDRDAGQFGQRIERSLGFAKMAAQRLSPADRQEPTVAAALTKLDGLVACKDAIAARRKAVAGAAADTKAAYFAFKKDVTRYYQTYSRLISFANDLEGNTLSTPQAADIQKWRADLEAVAALCTGPHAGVRNDPRYGRADDANPEKICLLAERREAVMQKLASNEVRRFVQGVTRAFEESVAQFEARDGYLHIDAGLAAKGFYEPDTLKREVAARFAELLAAAHVDAEAGLWADFDKARDALVAKADAAAASWKRPAKNGSSRGAGVAKKAFTRGGNAVKAAYITRGEWQIIKNALGIPLRRTQPGYVVYKAKANKGPLDGKWCRGRSFTYKEQWDGRRYQPSEEVSELGYVRFEKCP